MRIYLAGGMRGYDKFNFPAFDEASARGRSLGHEIISPADMDREIGFTGDEPDEAVTPEFLHGAAQRDLAEVLKCDAIALLEGWEKSKGAMAEYTVAVWLNKGILDARTFQAYTGFTPPATQEPAEEIKYGDFVVKDSGSRQVFSTGAQRDNGDVKGYYHLLPMIAVEREAQLYEAGARKYGKDNWRKGIPLSRFIDSAFRHLFKLAAGWKDEDHAAAVRWNVGCFMETEKRINEGALPAELDDLAGKGL